MGPECGGGGRGAGGGARGDMGRAPGAMRAQTSEPSSLGPGSPAEAGGNVPQHDGEEGNLSAGSAVRPHVLGRLVTRHYSGARWPAQQTRLHIHALSEHPDNPGVSGLLAEN